MKSYLSVCRVIPSRNYQFFFTGPYEDKDLLTLIAFEKADIIYFPAQWPETYSYTLSAALSSGLPILAPSFGAFVERLCDYSNAYLIEWDASALAVNNRLHDIVARGLPEAERPEPLLGSSTPRIYLKQYLIAIGQIASIGEFGQISLGELIKAEYVFPELTDSIIDNLGRGRLIEIIKKLIGLPSDGILTLPVVESSQDELLAKQKALIDQLAEKEQTLVELKQYLVGQCEELQQEILNRESFIQEIYSSNSWRFTQPFRWLSQQCRRWLH